jgi:hypothetical protein
MVRVTRTPYSSNRLPALSLFLFRLLLDGGVIRAAGKDTNGSQVRMGLSRTYRVELFHLLLTIVRFSICQFFITTVATSVRGRACSL